MPPSYIFITPSVITRKRHHAYGQWQCFWDPPAHITCSVCCDRKSWRVLTSLDGRMLLPIYSTSKDRGNCIGLPCLEELRAVEAPNTQPNMAFIPQGLDGNGVKVWWCKAFYGGCRYDHSSSSDLPMDL